VPEGLKVPARPSRIVHITTTTVRFWAKAGGLSARSMTEANVQKNKGSIVAGKGKKITFDRIKFSVCGLCG
jgi:hypothetical protein